MAATRIFIIEDEPSLALDLQRKLQRLGYEVTGIAPTGEEALLLVEQCLPDLIISDIMLDGPMDGVEATATIRKSHDLPVIFLSSLSDDATIARAKRTEPYAYLVKPCDEKDLRAAVEIALYRQQMERERRELITRLEEALAEVRTLHGLLPICMDCKKIRDDGGYWNQLESYISRHTDAEFSHGLCPDCFDRRRSDIEERISKEHATTPSSD
jgi:CheY-like chemotaxis protein